MMRDLPQGTTPGLPRLTKADGIYAAMLLVLVAVFFYKFLFFGLIPLNADWQQANFNPGRAYMPGLIPYNTELDDPVYQFYPLRMEAVSQWRDGTWPLWNPKILCGTPLLADGITKPLDPFILLWFVFAGPVAHGLELVAHFVLMIMGMYVLARALKIAAAGAALAAAAYTFGFLGVTWMELRTTTAAFAFFPWAFLFLYAAVEGTSVTLAVVAALLAAMMQFAGHPQFVIYAFFFMGIYVLWAAVAKCREGARKGFAALGVGALALALGLLLAAVELVPFIELNLLTARSVRQYEALNRFSTPVSFLPYVFPKFFGSPAQGIYYGAAVLWRPFMTATGGYVGAATLVFAAAGLFLGRFERKKFFLAVATGVGAFLLLMSLGLGDLLGRLSFLVTGMDMARVVFMSNVAIALLAGAGASALMEASWDDTSFRKAAMTAALGFVAAVAVMGTLGWTGRALCFFDNEQWTALSWFLAMVKGRYGNVLLAPAVFVPTAFLLGACWIVALAPVMRRWAAVTAFVFVAAELLITVTGHNPYVPADLITPPFAVLESMKTAPGEGRLLGVDPPGSVGVNLVKGDCLIPNSAILYGLEDIRGDQSLRLDRYMKYIRRVVGPGVNLVATTHLPVFDSPLIDALNVTHFLSAAPLAGEGIRETYDDGKAFAYENTRATPRAYLVGTWLQAASDTDALNKMCARADFDPHREVVLETDRIAPDAVPEDFTGQAAIVEYKPRRVAVKTTCRNDSVLVLADAYFVGWKACVDGVEEPIMPADATLRAVFLPPGEHDVEFVYRPLSFVVGAGVSLGAAALAFAILMIAILTRRKPPRSCELDPTM